MKRIFAMSVLVGVAVATFAHAAQANPAQDLNIRLTARSTIAKMKATWDSVKAYECMVTVHEAKGDSVQDRVYLVRFERPTQTRVDIVEGDGRGSAAIWNGGDRVRGHQGGFLSVFKLYVNLHSKLAMDLRGSTIADANFGSLIAHLESLDPRVEHVSTARGRIMLVVKPDHRTPDTDVTKEVYILASNWLPLEYYEYAEDKVVRHVVNSGVKLNIDIPTSTWRL
jgi:hypothetical protein